MIAWRLTALKWDLDLTVLTVVLGIISYEYCAVSRAEHLGQNHCFAQRPRRAWFAHSLVAHSATHDFWRATFFAAGEKFQINGAPFS